MPMNPNNTKDFYYKFMGDLLETVTLYKRGDDQLQGQVTQLKLFRCRWSKIQKSGQTVDGDVLNEHFRMLHIPRTQLDRVRVLYLNPLDTFVDKEGRWWRPEAPDIITVKMFENQIDLATQRITPP